jgi:hypothetical protein
VLGLHDDVDRGVLDGRRVVRDDDDLGGAGEGRGDADDAGHLALGDRHVDVAGAADDVDGPDRSRAVGHGGDGLGAADGVDLVDAGEGGGGQHGGRHGAGGAVGWDAQDDLAHAGHLGGHGRHEDGGRVGAAAAGHVDAGPVDGHRPAAHDEAAALVAVLGAQLGAVEVLDGVARRGEGGDEARVRGGQGGVEVCGRDPQGVELDAVEAGRVLAHGLVAPGPHVVEDGPDHGDRLVTAGSGPGQVVAQVPVDAPQVEPVERGGGHGRSAYVG